MQLWTSWNRSILFEYKEDDDDDEDDDDVVVDYDDVDDNTLYILYCP